nr:hypothetical protein [uncultured Ruminococcus sp.]
MTELKDTVVRMNSDDYKERFQAEFTQLRIRREKLEAMIVNYKAGTLDFTPACPIGILEYQLRAMSDYLYALKIRAEIEDIELEG